MKTGTMVDHARDRARVHVLDFNHLYKQIRRDELDESSLSENERPRSLFPALDYWVCT